ECSMTDYCLRLCFSLYRDYYTWLEQTVSRLFIPISALQFQISSLRAAFLKGSQDFQHMKRQINICREFPLFPERSCHLGKSQPSAVLPVREEQRHFTKNTFLRPKKFDSPVKRIGIGNAKRTLSSVDLQECLAVIVNVKGHRDIADRAVFKSHQPSVIGRNFHVDLCSLFRLAGD